MSHAPASERVSSLQILISLQLINSPNVPALELAIEAIHAPSSRRPEKTGRQSWRQRATAAANSLSKLFPSIDLALLNQTKNILRQAMQPRPALDDSRLFADAMNLEDFGIHGLLQHALHLGSIGADLPQLLESFEQQEQYGYWEARLKEDFHFEPTRQLAARRLDHLRSVAAMLKEERDAGG
jgi:hypothetical protein